MNIQEFEEQKDSLQCKRCGHNGLDLYAPPNANHKGAKCRHCGSPSPLAQQWFSQNGSKEHVRKTKHDVAEVWQRCGNHCSFCGKNWKLCERLNISRQAQHVHPVMFGGREEGLVIPICSRCQEMTRPLLLETRDVMIALAEFDIQRKA